MEGFSHKETVRYYEKIIKQAWEQVEDADTPEVKSEKFNDHMGWTMLDGDFEDKTQDVFRSGPVYVPIWWNRYDPDYSSTRTAGSSTARPSSTSRSGGGALPNLPGGEFTEPPQAMPDKYKVPGCSITAYWNYYEGEKYTVANADEMIITRPKEYEKKTI